MEAILANAFGHFITLWVVIDPIGTIPVFIAVTAAMTAAERRRTAGQAALVATGVLLFFLVFGQLLINALGIGLLSFQVAGGIVLFLFALTMIFGESKPEHEADEAGVARKGRPDRTVGVFPLAVPSLASPGAMLAIVLLTDNRRTPIPEQVVIALIMMLVVAAAYLCMRMSGRIIRVIGIAGSAIVSRVMGMILASVAVNSVLSALMEIIRTGQL